ncbi:MAG TPA: hypothetical protein VER36_08930, partial [Flavisolibacter sp.]|nr:hypothetical protein [Flavisolibacter sp.]
MKKTFVLTGVTALLLACNSETKDGSVTTTPTTNTTENNATARAPYTPGDGDVSYRDGKVQVWRNNNWTASENDVTLDD